MTPEAAHTEALAGAVIVDTRPVSLRVADGEIPDSVVVERNNLEWRLDPTSPWRIPQIERADQRVIVVCDEGYASSLAAASLQDVGLNRATDVIGGFQAGAPRVFPSLDAGTVNIPDDSTACQRPSLALMSSHALDVYLAHSDRRLGSGRDRRSYDARRS